MNITQLEIPCLTEQYNLTDGHAFRPWSPRERAVVARAGELFAGVHRGMTAGLEWRFVQSFAQLAGVSGPCGAARTLVCSSASTSLEIVGNHLRLSGRAVALVEPCFDNLADIYKRHGIRLSPLREEILQDGTALIRAVDGAGVGAVCLVTPNNPTGTVVPRGTFEDLAAYCAATDKILIVDAAFRLYQDAPASVDHYAILESAGASYAVIEDTGKTWPTHELKASSLTVSEDLWKPIYRIYTDFTLHPSPFTLALLCEMVDATAADSLGYIRNLIRTNRGVLAAAAGNHGLTPEETSCFSVAWVRLDRGWSAREFCAVAARGGVHVLPGDYFNWSDHSQGAGHVRVALMRDPVMFQAAITALCAVLPDRRTAVR